MASDQRILTAFLLNLFFAVAEGIGGVLTGSVSVLSDAVHDLGDSIGIGISFVLERIGKKHSDSHYTYGYTRYSVLGSVITNLLLIFGSIVVTVTAVRRLLHPVTVEHDGMILFAVFGILVNGVAAAFTHRGESLNQKAVSLHMLEDVLGWVCVLAGAVVIKLTGFVQIDAIISIGVAVFLTVHAVKGLKAAMAIFLEKVPDTVDLETLSAELTAIDGVAAVHHLHLHSLDGFHHAASVHVVTASDSHGVRTAVEYLLTERGAVCTTVQIEHPDTVCTRHHCHIVPTVERHCHHHH